jgi:hypothetical protein
MTSKKKPEEKPLTNAYKRVLLTLGVAMVRVKHNGVEIECDTPAEAVEVLRHISDAQEDDAEIELERSLVADVVGRSRRWQAKTFQEFVDALGETQQRILESLVKHMCASDEQLRELAGVTSNQQLAGILSGISKQAAAVGMPARSVFVIQNESKSGKVEKTYWVSPGFAHLAREMNWSLD